MKKKLNVLLLEDNPSDAVLALRELRKAWEDVNFIRVYSAEKMKRELFSEDWDVIVSDFSMPQFTGLDGLKILQDSGLEIPFIMVSGTMGEDVAVSVMKAGAGDYILKDKLHRLVPAIERELADKAIRREHKRTATALNKSQALSQAVIDGSPLGISVRDQYGTLILYNKAWQEIWDFSEAEIEHFKQKRMSLQFDDNDLYIKDYHKKLREVYEKGTELYLRELKLDKGQKSAIKWISQHFYAIKDKRNQVERVVVLSEDITARKNLDLRQSLTRRILQQLNKQENWERDLHIILDDIHKTLDLECIAIRLSEKDDFPYKDTIGYRPEFVEKERYLASKYAKDNNSGNNFECLCGRIVTGDVDYSQPYITDNGSFWTNNLNHTSSRQEFADDKIITRYSCIKEKFKSMALIPLRAGVEIVGLLQISDHREDTFSAEILKYLEEVGATIAIAYQRIISEVKVQYSEKQLRSLFDNSVMGIFRLSKTGEIQMMNSRLLSMLGFETIEEFMTSQSTAADDFRRMTRQLYNTYILDHNLIQRIEASWTRNNKDIVFVRTSAKGIEDDNGELQYIDGVLEDRTDRVKATRELLESRERYRSLVEKANVGIVTDDLDGNITYFNKKFAELFGYTPEEMERLDYADLFHPTDMDKMRTHHHLRITGQDSPPRYELKGIKKDDTVIDLEIAVDHILDQNFNILGTRAFIWDVTERKQTDAIQRALYNISVAISSSQNLNELYLQIKTNMSNIIDTTNIFVALYDKEKDELSLPFEVDEYDHFETFPAGNSLSSYIIKKGEAVMLYEEDIKDLARKGIIDIIGTVAKIFLGAPLKIKEETIGVIVVQSYDNPNLYSERDLQILSIVSTEIAVAIDKRKAEDNLLAAHEELKILHKSLEEKVETAVKESREKDQVIMQQSRQLAVGEMISNIAHHWRQPLNVIGVAFQSVKEAFEFDDLTQEYMEKKTDIIMGILKSLSQTIDDFRFFHRQESEKSLFEVKGAVEKTLFTINSKFEYSKIKLSKELDCSIMIEGFENEYSQVVLNILNNAYDIFLERSVPKPEVNIVLKEINGHSYLSIRDNGGGVDEKIKDRIFDLYASTKSKLNNTGVGLYVSRMIVEQHMNGSLILKNHSDGAEFIIEI